MTPQYPFSNRLLKGRNCAFIVHDLLHMMRTRLY